MTFTFLTINLKSAGPTPATTMESAKFPTSINVLVKLSKSFIMPSTTTRPMV